MHSGKRTIIYGGSFDPVHKAHIDIIEKLCRRFDRVIVMPCKISPFKTKTPAPDDVRLEMLRLALPGTTAEISTFELSQEKPSLSYLTAEAFAGGQLYWAIGGEMLTDLSSWNNFDRLAELVTFYVIPRPGYPLDIEAAVAYNNARLELADFSGLEGSSSEVKITVAMGKPELFLTSEVAAYIGSHGLYTDYAYVNGLFEKYGLKPKRIRHSYSTALTGMKLAKRANLDTEQAATALLLHDIGKYVTLDDAREMGLTLPGEIYGMPESIRHAVIGEAILAQREGITDKGILDAVRWHTTGRADMSMLEIIVFLADYIEPLRSFNGVDEVRAATDISIADGLIAALGATVKYFPADKLYSATFAAYEYYKRRH